MGFSREDYQAALANDLYLKLGISPEEPLFLLRGQDKCAALAVRCWAVLAAAFGADPQTVASAHRQADLMEAWEPQKLPDLPARYEKAGRR